MTPAELAASVKDPIARVGGGFMLSAQAKQAGKEAGLRGWQFYFIGRGGVLGDVDAEVVSAALGFFPPEGVRTGWEAARAVLTPAEGVRRFVAVNHEWGRTHLSAASELDVLAPLLEQVARGVDSAGRSLFAGWRTTLSMLPADPPARVAHLCHVLREHRGACHLAAVLASGLTPLESVLIGGGAGNATFFGWPEPYADVAALAGRRERAEALTDEIVGVAWAGVLSDAEAAEAARLLGHVGQVAFDSMVAG